MYPNPLVSKCQRRDGGDSKHFEIEKSSIRGFPASLAMLACRLIPLPRFSTACCTWWNSTSTDASVRIIYRTCFLQHPRHEPWLPLRNPRHISRKRVLAGKKFHRFFRRLFSRFFGICFQSAFQHVGNRQPRLFLQRSLLRLGIIVKPYRSHSHQKFPLLKLM